MQKLCLVPPQRLLERPVTESLIPAITMEDIKIEKEQTKEKEKELKLSDTVGKRQSQANVQLAPYPPASGMKRNDSPSTHGRTGSRLQTAPNSADAARAASVLPQEFAPVYIGGTGSTLVTAWYRPNVGSEHTSVSLPGNKSSPGTKRRKVKRSH